VPFDGRNDEPAICSHHASGCPVFFVGDERGETLDLPRQFVERRPVDSDEDPEGEEAEEPGGFWGWLFGLAPGPPGW
jgi:hypothetical protein